MTTDLTQSKEKRMTKLKAWVLKRMPFLKRLMTIQAICGEQSTTPTAKGLKSLDIIQSIKDITLADFIVCSVDADFSVLGKGTPEELYAAWLKIVGEYQFIRGDENISRHLEVVVKMQAIEFRQIYIDYLIYTLDLRYTDKIAELLREEHSRFQFTTETYLKDLKAVRTIEKRHLLEYDTLKAELEQIEKQQAAQGNKKMERLDYINLLLDINKHEGCKYDESISMEKFALCVKRLEQHVKRMKEKEATHGR